MSQLGFTLGGSTRGTLGEPLLLGRLVRAWHFEPAKPFAHERKLRLGDGVDASSAALLLPEQPSVFEHAQVPSGRRPLVRETPGDFPRSRGTAEVDGHEDLSPRWVGQRGDDGIQSRKLGFCVEGQSGSTSQMVSSSNTGPMVSHTAMTSGVWCAVSLDLPSFQTKYSMNCSRCLRMS